MDVGDPAAAGHFTTVQVRDGAVQGLDLHMARLREANRQLFGAGLDEDALRVRIRAVLSGTPDRSACTLRIVVRAAGHGPDRAIDIGVETQPPRVVGPASLSLRSHKGLRACPGVKHLDLDFQLDARGAAQAAGFDDALLVDGDGRVAEGTFWNVALWDGTAIIWPRARILEGVTQRLLQAALHEAGIPQRHALVPLDGLARMRAMFALNSRGLQDVGSVDGCALERDPGMAALLRDLLARCPWQRP